MCEKQIDESSRRHVSEIPAQYSLDTSVDGGGDVAAAELPSTTRGRRRDVSVSPLLRGWSCQCNSGQHKDGADEVCDGDHGDRRKERSGERRGMALKAYLLLSRRRQLLIPFQVCVEPCLEIFSTLHLLAFARAPFTIHLKSARQNVRKGNLFGSRLD